MKKCLLPLLCLMTTASPAAKADMVALEDDTLSDIDGRFGVVLKDFYIDNDDYSSLPTSRHGRIRIASDYWNESEISEFRLHKSVSTGGARNIGADLGTDTAPLLYTVQSNGLLMTWPGFMDKIDLHFRVDSRREIDLTNSLVFDSMVDIRGLHISKGSNRVWAAPGRGMLFSSVIDMSAESIRVQTVDPLLNPTVAQVEAATMSLYGIQIENMATGTDQQPAFLRSFRDSNNLAQIQMEVSPVNASNPRAPKANLYIDSLEFGDFKWAGSGYSMPAGVTRPFVPLAGQKLVTIKGMELQHLRITTQDIF